MNTFLKRPAASSPLHLGTEMNRCSHVIFMNFFYVLNSAKLSARAGENGGPEFARFARYILVIFVMNKMTVKFRREIKRSPE